MGVPICIKERYTMILDKLRYLILVLSVLFSSCGEKPEPIGMGITCKFVPTECDLLEAMPYYLADVNENNNIESFVPCKLEETSVRAKLFCLKLYISSDNEFEHDSYVENQIIQYYIKSVGKHYGGSVMDVIEYHREICKSLTITTDVDLFGRKAGEDISDKFVFRYNGEYNFLFSGDRKLIGQIETGMTVNEYLSYNPLMFSKAYMVLSEIPVELPADVTFFIETQLQNGKELSDMVHITLTK